MRKTIAFLLALVLTGTLVLFCGSLIGRQALDTMTDAQVSDSVIREQQLLARQRIAELADLYGFEAEPVSALVNGDLLRDLNRQASDWWNTLLQDGIVGDRPEWEADNMEEILASDPKLGALEDRNYAESLAASAAENVRKSISRMVLPMRVETLRLGMQKIQQKIDTVSLISFFRGVPWAALAMCALLAGLIVLLKSRRFPGSVLYIGSALGGAALTLATLVILCLCAGTGAMVREASLGLEILFRSVSTGALINAGIQTAVLAAGCFLCLNGNRIFKRNRANRVTV